MAANFILGLAMFAQSVPNAEMQAEAWKHIQPSLVTVEGPSGPVGAAILIDKKGLFLAHSNSIPNAKLVARTHDGTAIPLAVRNIDSTTNLLLLEAGWWRDRNAVPATVSSLRDFVGQSVIACLPSGPVTGQFVSADRVGILRPSLRYAPLSEIRFESQEKKVAGAFVFSNDGKLIGVMNATLEPVGGTKKSINDLELPGRQLVQRDTATTPTQNSDYGPRGLTVGYALGVEVLKRVVDGFRSKTRIVAHPTIGCFFRDAAGKGAYIEALLPDSAAARAGLKISDIVVEANGQLIRNHLDLAVFLFRQNVGAPVNLKVKRSAQTVELNVTVGQQEHKDSD